MAKKKAVAKKKRITPFKQAVIDYAIQATRAYKDMWFSGLDERLAKLEKSSPEMIALGKFLRNSDFDCRDTEVRGLTRLILNACGVKDPIPAGDLDYPHKDLDGELPFLGVVVAMSIRCGKPSSARGPLLSVGMKGEFDEMLSGTGRQVSTSEYQDQHRPATDDEVIRLITMIPSDKLRDKTGQLGAFFHNVTGSGSGEFATGGKKKPRPTKKKKKKVAKKRGRR